MLNIHRPACKKAFHWTDDMPVRGEFPNMDDSNYDLNSALKQTAIVRFSVAERIFCVAGKFSLGCIYRHFIDVAPAEDEFREKLYPHLVS